MKNNENRANILYNNLYNKNVKNHKNYPSKKILLLVLFWFAIGASTLITLFYIYDNFTYKFKIDVDIFFKSQNGQTINLTTNKGELVIDLQTSKFGYNDIETRFTHIECKEFDGNIFKRCRFQQTIQIFDID